MIEAPGIESSVFDVEGNPLTKQIYANPNAENKGFFVLKNIQLKEYGKEFLDLWVLL
jgi:hypothetical protein